MAMVLTAFLLRVNPVSTMAKPTCMNITRKAPSRTQGKFIDWVKVTVDAISASFRSALLNARVTDAAFVDGIAFAAKLGHVQPCDLVLPRGAVDDQSVDQPEGAVGDGASPDKTDHDADDRGDELRGIAIEQPAHRAGHAVPALAIAPVGQQ